MDIKDGLEIVHHADLPARSGLGSSSTFTVGMLHALNTYKGQIHTSMREHTSKHISLSLYIYIYRERERERHTCSDWRKLIRKNSQVTSEQVVSFSFLFVRR